MAKKKVPKSAPSDYGLTSTGTPTVDAALMEAAEQYGIPPAVMFATAQQESGLNPQAVGDQGTSFGLFQEHEGGELTSVAFAENPVDAAQKAAQTFAAARAQMPNATWGQIVAAAQRPANQAAYAQSVNGMLGKAGNMPASQAASVLGGSVSPQLLKSGDSAAAYSPSNPSTSELALLGSVSNAATPAPLQAYQTLNAITQPVTGQSVPGVSSLNPVTTYNQATAGLPTSNMGTASNSSGIVPVGDSASEWATAIQQSYPQKQ